MLLTIEFYCAMLALATTTITAPTSSEYKTAAPATQVYKTTAPAQPPNYATKVPNTPTGGEGKPSDKIHPPTDPNTPNGKKPEYTKSPEYETSPVTSANPPATPKENDPNFPKGTGVTDSDKVTYKPNEKPDGGNYGSDKPKPSTDPDYKDPKDNSYNGGDTVLVGKEKVPVCSEFDSEDQSGVGTGVNGKIRLGNMELAKLNIDGKLFSKDGLGAIRGGLSLLNGKLFKVGAGGTLVGESLGQACVEASALGERGQGLVGGKASAGILNPDGIVGAKADAGVLADTIAAGADANALGEKGLASLGGKLNVFNIKNRAHVSALHEGKLIDTMGDFLQNK